MGIIVTKYYGPTDTMGSRIKATTDQAGKNYSKWISYDYLLTGKENHIAAFRKLASSLTWLGEYSIGETESGYVFVDLRSDRCRVRDQDSIFQHQ